LRCRRPKKSSLFFNDSFRIFRIIQYFMTKDFFDYWWWVLEDLWGLKSYTLTLIFHTLSEYWVRRIYYNSKDHNNLPPIEFCMGTQPTGCSTLTANKKKGLWIIDHVFILKSAIAVWNWVLFFYKVRLKSIRPLNVMVIRNSKRCYSKIVKSTAMIVYWEEIFFFVNICFYISHAFLEDGEKGHGDTGEDSSIAAAIISSLWRHRWLFCLSYHFIFQRKDWTALILIWVCFTLFFFLSDLYWLIFLQACRF